ncbi:hypothetical protein T459_34289 [Capsicum annuum]|uniref:Uncharacterized protein n=1 Tax=Capsicum annuum TaxID=4072 RepID=A0A2G2XWM5_CAPAN|nr:hypothetical protein T459_34289 [Capsicum annuum]
MTDFEVEVKEVANIVEYKIQLKLPETIMEKNKSIRQFCALNYRRGTVHIGPWSPRWTGWDWRDSRSRDRVWSESPITCPHPISGTDFIILSTLISIATKRHDCYLCDAGSRAPLFSRRRPLNRGLKPRPGDLPGDARISRTLIGMQPQTRPYARLKIPKLFRDALQPCPIATQQENLKTDVGKVITAKYRNENSVDMAHASVASLMRTVESLLTSNSPMQSLIRDHREELCALSEKVSSLEVFVKNFEKNNVSGEMTDFEVEHQRNHWHKIFQRNLNIWTLRKFHKSFRQLAKDIDHVRKESTKIQDKGKQASKELLVHDFSSSTDDILNVNNNMVGCDDQKERLLEDLIGSYSGEPKVIPIVGMG